MNCKSSIIILTILEKVVGKVMILLVPVIMACATIGTIGMIKGISHINNRNK